MHRIVALLALSSSAAFAAAPPIVYSRCPRHGGPVAITGPVTKNGTTTMMTAMLRGIDIRELLPDTANRFESFIGPCDLVYRSAQGTERVLYSCIANSDDTNACAALDPAVSFDAKTVAFSVVKGRLRKMQLLTNGRFFDPTADATPFRVDIPSKHFVENSTDAQLHLVDVETGQVTPLPHVAGDFDSGPTFLSNGRLAFTSTRAKAFRTVNATLIDTKRAPQLYAMDVDGRNVEQLSPHALAAELHPLQLVDGRIAVSSWQSFGMQPYRSSTPVNDFHIYVQNPDGAKAFALYGQHLADRAINEAAAGFETHVSAHFFGQTSDGRLWTAEYYRHNNFSLGVIVGFPLPPEGQEGPNVAEAKDAGTTPYRPWGQVNLAPWATMTDSDGRRMPAPAMTIPTYADPLAYAGKLGHPAGIPGNRLMVTWGIGPCYVGQGDTASIQALQASMGDNPMCDTGVYVTAPIPPMTHQWLRHPSELELVVNSPDFHEFMARPVVPYRDVFGVDRPAQLPRAEVAAAGDVSLEPGTPFGVLASSSILHRETNSLEPFKFENQVQWGRLGTDTVDYTDDELCGVRILITQPTRSGEVTLASESPAGERVVILGEFPVRKTGPGGQPVLDGLQLPDTSFRVRIPAATPYVMQGIDCQGRTLNSDQTWQSLRPGEVKTCNGCHVHSRAATLLPFQTTAAAQPTYTTVTLGMGQVPLLTGGAGAAVQTRTVEGYGYAVEFERDVMPIFSSRCVSCHGAARAEAGLRLDLPRTLAMRRRMVADTSTWFRLAADDEQTFVPATSKAYVGAYRQDSMGKPNLSKYVRMLNARGSLLYWKAANRRTDGRTDAQFPSTMPTPAVPNRGQYDIDFGADHPTTITADELAVLSRWIDTGAVWGADALVDTVRPVLHLAAEVADGGVQRLKVGTADVGTGIDPASLSVCVQPAGSPACGPNLAGPAAMAGVITVDLPTALSALDDEVVARVRDRAGNSVEARLTVRFLLSQPAPAPSTPDGGSMMGTGGGSPDPGGEPDGGDLPDGGLVPDGGGVVGRCGCSGGGSGLALAGLGVVALRRRRRRAAPRGLWALLLANASCLGEAPVIDVPATGTDDAGVVHPGDGGSLIVDAGTDDAGVEDAGVALDAGAFVPDASVLGCSAHDVGDADGGVAVTFHDGQSFIRWTDKAAGDAGVAFRYDVFRSERPFVSGTLAGAEFIARGVLSNSAKQYGYAFYERDRIDPSRPTAIITQDGGPLPMWSGLQVYTAKAAACAYYAVLATQRDGGALETVTPGVNTTVVPIAERVEPKQPLLLLEAARRTDPSRSRFLITGTPRLPLQVVLHASSAAGGLPGSVGDLWLTYGDATMGYRDGMQGLFSVEEWHPELTLTGIQELTLRTRDTIVNREGQPDETYWFGYAAVPDGASTPARAHPFTERRLEWLIDTVVARYRVDPERVYCSGGSMGAWGTLAFGLRRPERFAAIFPDRPRTQQRSLPAVGVTLPAAQALMDDGVTPYLERMDSVRFVRAHPGDLPFVGWGVGRRDGFATWKEHVDFARAMADGRHGFAFAWDDTGHGSTVITTVLRDYPSTRFALHQSYPAFSNSSLDDDLGDGGLDSGAPQGGINLGFGWTVLRDTATEWSVEVSNTRATSAMTVDVTPRKCGQFRPPPQGPVTVESSSGPTQTLTADVNGLVTALGVRINPSTATTLTFRR